MSLGILLLLAFLAALYFRCRPLSAVIGIGLLCGCTAYGLWATFFGAIFALPVFLLGMAVLVAVAGTSAQSISLLRKLDSEIPYLRPFLRALSGGLLVYSIVPLAFLAWFIFRLFNGLEMPDPFQLVLLIALPVSLPFVAIAGWRLGSPEPHSR